jgi:hypothetical protein
MKKQVSTWIDNTKVRNEIYSFNQAVKQVYNGYRFTSDGIVIPSSVEAIKSPQVFNKSLFVHFKYANPFPFLEDSVIYPEELNKALKDKCTDYSIRDGVHYLSGTNKAGDKLEYATGAPMTEFQKEDTSNYRGLAEFHKLTRMNAVLEYSLDGEDISTLLEYKVLDKDIGMYKKKPVHIIVSKEIFPVIKKADCINISVYDYNEVPDGVYEILISSCAATWSFYSIHYILS